MKSVLNKINSKFLLGLLAMTFLALTLVNLGVSWRPNEKSATTAFEIIRDPIVLAVIGAILTFLLIDRWRRLEAEVSEIRQSQLAALKDLREDAKNLFKENIEGATRTAQALESKISGLLENHPWIADITENEFIPDASSCRIVLLTAEELLEKGKISLVYEYIFGWVKRPASEPGLEGTAEDFLDLTDFCERVLLDEYLGYLILREGARRAIGSDFILPDYLRRLTRFGRVEDAKRISDQLRRIVNPKWPDKIFALIKGKPSYHRASFLMRAQTSMAIYEALVGNAEDSGMYLNCASGLASGLGAESDMRYVKAEIMVISGKYDQVEKEMASPDLVADYHAYDAARLFRSIGKTGAALDLFERARTIEDAFAKQNGADGKGSGRKKRVVARSKATQERNRDSKTSDAEKPVKGTGLESAIIGLEEPREPQEKVLD